MDHVLIEGFEFETVIGVYDWEKQILQRLRIDLELACDIQAAAEKDDIALTLDYAAITGRIAEYARAQHFELVETYAERIAELLIEEFDVKDVLLTLRKPTAVPAARAVGVRIHRSAPLQIRDIEQ